MKQVREIVEAMQDFSIVLLGVAWVFVNALLMSAGSLALGIMMQESVSAVVYGVAVLFIVPPLPFYKFVFASKREVGLESRDFLLCGVVLVTMITGMLVGRFNSYQIMLTRDFFFTAYIYTKHGGHPLVLFSKQLWDATNIAFFYLLFGSLSIFLTSYAQSRAIDKAIAGFRRDVEVYRLRLEFRPVGLLLSYEPEERVMNRRMFDATSAIVFFVVSLKISYVALFDGKSWIGLAWLLPVILIGTIVSDFSRKQTTLCDIPLVFAYLFRATIFGGSVLYGVVFASVFYFMVAPNFYGFLIQGGVTFLGLSAFMFFYLWKDVEAISWQACLQRCKITSMLTCLS